MLVSWGRIVDKPRIIEGGLSVDDRGIVSYANDFDFKDVKRFYMVENHSKNYVRAWHSHQYESKYVLVVRGAVKLGVVKLDSMVAPSINLNPEIFILSDKKPSILYIPARYANGFMTLTEETQIIFYSDKTLKQSEGDDYRYNARLWNIWPVEER
jgi:dTDP-4-dehydrorhamnose 3,5-epimerase-like enzyme